MGQTDGRTDGVQCSMLPHRASVEHVGTRVECVFLYLDLKYQLKRGDRVQRVRQ